MTTTLHSEVERCRQVVRDGNLAMADRLIRSGHDLAHQAAEGGGFPLHVAKGRSWLQSSVADLIELHDEAELLEWLRWNEEAQS